MAEQTIRQVIAACQRDRQPCKVWFACAGGRETMRRLIPLAGSDALFLSAAEDRFALDGCTIRRWDDVTRAAVQEGIYREILQSEGVLADISVPDVDITRWDTVFRWFRDKGDILVAEQTPIDGSVPAPLMGKAEIVYPHCAYLRPLDSEGVWGTCLERLPYMRVAGVTFGSRELRLLARYTGEYRPDGHPPSIPS